jgi:parallel beta-helix repeat protein
MAALVVLGLGTPTLHAQVPGVSTQTIDVDGISTRYHTAGLQTRQSGQPVVVLQSGGGGTPLERWAGVLAGLEDRAAVLAHDRPGSRGTSSPEGPLTLALVSEQLHDLIYPHLRRFLEGLDETVATDTAHVAAPSGEESTDRASIMAALAAVHPGGVVQFGPGTYLIGELLRVYPPRIRLLGHPQGTTIRGCERAEEAERLERFACHGFELVGGKQTVRGFTFEQADFDLVLGCCLRDPGAEATAPSDEAGGYLVEHNVFRNSRTSIRVIAGGSEPTVIRDNVFRNTGHAVGINRGTVHVLDNDISAPNPQEIPGQSHTLGAIGVTPTTPQCGHNVIAGNRIEGHPDGIRMLVVLPGIRCQRNIIRNNTIIVQRLPIGDSPNAGLRISDESDRTLVGVPLLVADVSDAPDRPRLPPSVSSQFQGDVILGDHLIEGNRVIGAEGIGIEIRRSSGNRIAHNVVTRIEARHPFPGNLANSPDPESWRDANGAGIWLSPGSDHNEVVDNTFEEIASFAVAIEGDSNRVALRSANDFVVLRLAVDGPAPGGVHDPAPPIFDSLDEHQVTSSEWRIYQTSRPCRRMQS